MPESTLQPKQRAFIAAYGICGVITHACKAAEISRTAVYEWLSDSIEFKKAYDEAFQDACDRHEYEATRRAIEGDSKVVCYEGKPVFVWVNDKDEIVQDEDSGGVKQVVLVEHKKSDRMLEVRLKALMPEKYRERSENIIRTTTATEEEIAALERRYGLDRPAGRMQGALPDSGPSRNGTHNQN